VDQRLDVRGLRCPVPYVKARALVGRLAPGETLVVLATDPEAPVDLGALAAEEELEFSVDGEAITLRRPLRRDADRPHP
jgi:tRNA 2-thiouridine synthesizing protein A